MRGEIVAHRRIERARVFRRTTRTAGTLSNTLLGNAVLVSTLSSSSCLENLVLRCVRMH